MKIQYKHIHFVNCGVENGKTYYACKNNKSDFYLGTVNFYPTWKKYVFAAEEDIVFDIGCLADIQHFMSQLDKGVEQKEDVFEIRIPNLRPDETGRVRQVIAKFAKGLLNTLQTRRDAKRN